MELDLHDKQIDILDFYRGEISFRRMVVHVIHDIGRMPRTRAAVQGLPPGRPWEEINTQLKVIDTRLQSLLSVGWVSGRLKGNPPAIEPYPSPEPKSKTATEERAPRRPDPRWQAYLERFAPPKRHLKLVKPPPEEAPPPDE